MATRDLLGITSVCIAAMALDVYAYLFDDDLDTTSGHMNQMLIDATPKTYW